MRWILSRKIVRLENFEFITDYFGSLSLSPKRDDEGTAFVGSTCHGASTPQRAMIKDSTEEFLIVSSGEGSFDHLSPRRNMGASLAPATTTIWKENAPAMMLFSLQTVAPQSETNFPLEWCHAHHQGQQEQARARHPLIETRSVPW
jgi:hypothetical protein